MKSQTGDLCGADSFFEKTLQRVLDAEQLATYRAIVDERMRRRYRTAVEIALRDFEERVPLDSRQHEMVLRLLLERPTPQLIPNGSNTMLLVMYRLSQISSEQLEPLFEERHWTAFNQDRQRFGVYREHLRTMGLLPAE